MVISVYFGHILADSSGELERVDRAPGVTDQER